MFVRCADETRGGNEFPWWRVGGSAVDGIARLEGVLSLLLYFFLFLAVARDAKTHGRRRCHEPGYWDISLVLGYATLCPDEHQEMCSYWKIIAARSWRLCNTRRPESGIGRRAIPRISREHHRRGA
nr:hypothetical protein CFP56_34975 [Quercus suber]